jgi:hypothetical protein
MLLITPVLIMGIYLPLQKAVKGQDVSAFADPLTAFFSTREFLWNSGMHEGNYKIFARIAGSIVDRL